MRLQIFSDLHVDVAPAKEPRIAADIDAVVIAGDICEGMTDALTFARGLVPRPVPIIYVAGNHEHYDRNLDDELAEGKRIAPGLGIHFLENSSVAIGRVRFLGATLWTDYEFYGVDRRDAAMALAETTLNDHRRIRCGATWAPFRPADARAHHLESRAYLASKLVEPHDGPTVVVTHHLPHRDSVNARYRASPVNVAFASDLADVLSAGRPTLWVHGHTHMSTDFRIGATRIVCNPHGYGPENPAFDPCLVVEV